MVRVEVDLPGFPDLFVVDVVFCAEEVAVAAEGLGHFVWAVGPEQADASLRSIVAIICVVDVLVLRSDFIIFIIGGVGSQRRDLVPTLVLEQRHRFLLIQVRSRPQRVLFRGLFAAGKHFRVVGVVAVFLQGKISRGKERILWNYTSQLFTRLFLCIYLGGLFSACPVGAFKTADGRFQRYCAAAYCAHKRNPNSTCYFSFCQ